MTAAEWLQAQSAHSRAKCGQWVKSEAAATQIPASLASQQRTMLWDVCNAIVMSSKWQTVQIITAFLQAGRLVPHNCLLTPVKTSLSIL